jgi:hypothetical protein
MTDIAGEFKRGGVENNDLSGLTQNDKNKKLMKAATCGETARVRALLQAGAEIDYADGGPLYRAVAGGHTETVQALLEAGAQIEGRYSGLVYRAYANDHIKTRDFLMRWMENKEREASRERNIPRAHP